MYGSFECDVIYISLLFVALMSLATLAQTLILQHPDRLSNVELSKYVAY